jgi:hypothetical protein
MEIRAGEVLVQAIAPRKAKPHGNIDDSEQKERNADSSERVTQRPHQKSV